MKLLEQFYRTTLKDILHLPDSIANVACYLLLGILPIERQLHAKSLNLCGSIIRRVASVEREVANWQIMMRGDTTCSWFIYVNTLIHRYKLPNVSLICNHPEKEQWKKQVNREGQDWSSYKLPSKCQSEASEPKVSTVYQPHCREAKNRPMQTMWWKWRNHHSLLTPMQKAPPNQICIFKLHPANSPAAWYQHWSSKSDQVHHGSNAIKVLKQRRYHPHIWIMCLHLPRNTFLTSNTLTKTDIVIHLKWKKLLTPL